MGTARSFPAVSLIRFTIRSAMLRKLLAGSICVLLLALAISFVLKKAWVIHGIIEEPRSRYDVIIVGGGSAGCVLARRLWERANVSVLVVEAGGTAPWLSALPLLAPALQGRSADWAFKTVPQRHAQKGLNDQQSPWPRGKVLGGSSVLHYMLHMWGARSDFDRLWADQDWTFEAVRKYFKKSERTRIMSELRGRRGPMPVTEFDTSSSPLATAFLEGAAQMGLMLGDLNGELEHGAMPSQSNTNNGWRISAFDAYLDPVMERSKIHLLTNTQVTQIEVEGKKAVGVVAVNVETGAKHRIRADLQVVVSAGAVGSPHLLLLSGIGPAQHLRQHGIPVVMDLPGVGQNLRDHLNIPLYFHLDSPVSTTTTKIRSLPNIWKFLTKGQGHLSHSGVEAVARLPVPGNNLTTEKMFFMLFNLGSVNEGLFTTISNFKNETFQETFPDTKNDSKEGFILLASCTQPQSRGEILLSSNDPMEPPLIDPKYLSRAEDVKCLTRALRTAARLGSTPPLRSLGARLHLPAFGDCEGHQSLASDRYLECWLRTAAVTGYHPVATCAMGDVLDYRLRVRGLQNLRVVDSSAFPHPTSGNPHAAVLMLAEKAADYVISDFKTLRTH